MTATIVCLNLVYPRRLLIKILMFIPVIYVFYLNLPSVNWDMFLKINTEKTYGGSYVFIFNLLRGSTTVIAAAYLLMPMLFFGIYTAKTKIFVKKRYGITCMVCFFFMYVIIYLLFVDGIFTPIMFYNVDLMNFPQKNLGMYGENGSIMISVLCIIIINIYILLYFKPFEKYGAGTKRRFVKRSQMVNENVYMLLHIYKNKFVCIEKLVNLGISAEIKNEADEVVNVFNGIKKEVAESVENISRTLKMLNVVAMDYHVFTIESCIDEAIKKTEIESISIVRNYEGQKTVVLGNKAHIIESFVNILRNSIESIEQKTINDGKIEITVYTEPDMLCVIITDNGCGISAKDKKMVFRLFYTTKAQKVGNGLGLDFVKRVTAIHGGDVCIKSVDGLYTSVYMALPIYNLGRNAIHKLG